MNTQGPRAASAERQLPSPGPGPLRGPERFYYDRS